MLAATTPVSSPFYMDLLLLYLAYKTDLNALVVSSMCRVVMFCRSFQTQGLGLRMNKAKERCIFNEHATLDTLGLSGSIIITLGLRIQRTALSSLSPKDGKSPFSPKTEMVFLLGSSICPSPCYNLLQSKVPLSHNC